MAVAQLADIARESNYRAMQDGVNIISAVHVKGAYEGAKDRHGMLESKVSAMIADKMILLDTEGERVGQVNPAILEKIAQGTFPVLVKGKMDFIWQDFKPEPPKVETHG